MPSPLPICSHWTAKHPKDVRAASILLPLAPAEMTSPRSQPEPNYDSLKREEPKK
jgi:hypothetical protein